MLDKLQEQWKNLHPRSFTVSLRKQFPDIYQWVLDQPDIVPTKSTSDKAFTLLNPIQPVCQNVDCSNLVTGLNRHGWQQYCSPKCRGSHNSLKSRTKAMITSLENWGVTNPMQDISIATKMRERTKDKLGVEYALQSCSIRENMVKTMLDLYGVKYASQKDTFQDKMVKTYMKKYGVCNPSLRHITPDVTRKLNDPEWLAEQNKTLPFQPIADSLGVSTFTLSRAFKNFGIMPIRHNNFVSAPEKEITEFIRYLEPNAKIITSDRSVLSPYELDIFLPDLNLAFEYNGLYYHSEEFGKDNKYHLYKTTKCLEKGVKLIHIWENDYLNNKEIIFSKLAHLLGHSTKIYARKCIIRELDITESRKFFTETHIQGYSNSSVKIGLCIDNEIVACMSFGKSRFTNDAQWELLRYSSKLNHNVVGGFSRLLKYFIKYYKPTTIISYSDKCWSTGDVYKLNGFDYLRTSKPSYFYTKDGVEIKHRMLFQKNKMKSKLAVFDPKLTEWENMKNNGYIKIWNCGNDVWIWKK